MNNFILSVINELNMTNADLSLFTSPKAIFSGYRRDVIYSMTSQQIKLFDNIVTFDPNIKKLLDKKKALIAILDENVHFKDNNYISICFNIAHEYHIVTERKLRYELLRSIMKKHLFLLF